MNHIIFGGAFDPIHLGHMNMAQKAAKELNGDVFFIISRISVWKENSAPVEHKIKMLELAIKDYPNFKIDLFEVNSGKKVNYTIDTAKYFVKKYPKDKLFLLIGADQVEAFDRWKDAEELSKLVQIVYYDRPNHELTSENVKRYSMKKIEGEPIDITSSMIRSCRKLTTHPDVIKYIEENELYYMHFLKAILKESRYKHSISVAHLAYDIALANKVNDPRKAYIAGLLHDCGKYICEPLVDEKVAVKGYEDVATFPLVHQFVGALMAKELLKIQDEELLDAIKFHATGKANMSELGKIVYAADKLDPLRGYDSSSMIEAMKKDINEGFKTVLKANKEYFESKNINANNRLTAECMHQYLD